MSAEMIDGKALAVRRLASVAQEVEVLNARGIHPCLAAVSVGGDPSWDVYQKRQAQACQRAGLEYRMETLPPQATQQDMRERIEMLNADPLVHGIIIQSPLPGDMDVLSLQAQLSPAKDIEAVSPANLGLVLAGRQTHAPCTALAAMHLAHEACPEGLRGKEAVVIGSSVIVGKPIAQLLLSAGATPTVCHIDTVDLASHTMKADIIFVAVGVPGLLKPAMVRAGAVVIDVGINRITLANGKRAVVGDVDPAVADVAAAMSPVPGGVGSVTTSVLLEATVIAATVQQERRPQFDGSMLAQVLGARAADLPADLADDIARLMSQHMVQTVTDGHVRSPLAHRLETGVLILDGAIGTELIRRGIAVDAVDAANVRAPALVKAVHQSYMDAGVDVLTANTFGCNRFRCEDSEQAIIWAQAGVRLARQTARGRAQVMASMGPLGRVIGADIHPDEAADAYAEIALAMSDAGCDGFCVETMSSNAEACAALTGIRQVSRLPIFVSRNIQRDDPREIQDFAQAMGHAGAQAIGVNCITGVRSLTAIIARLASMTALPLIARPNAGYPQHRDGQFHYHLGVDYFCEKAHDYIAAGARIIGGCCGIGPQHIHALTQQRDALNARCEGEKPRSVEQFDVTADVTTHAVTERSAHNPLLQALDNGDFLKMVLMPSYLSPQRARAVAQSFHDAGVADSIDALGFISAWGNGTTHTALVSKLRFLEDASGQHVILDIDAQHRMVDIQDQLLNAHLLGVNSVIVDTGVFSAHPHPQLQQRHTYPQQGADYETHSDAASILRLIQQLNNGYDISGSRLESPCHFTIGVRVSAASIAHLAGYAAAGVDFAILQPVYAPQEFRACMDMYVTGGRCLPLLAEILILQDIETAEEIDNEIPALSVPQKLKDRLRADPENDVQSVLRFIKHWHKELAGVCLLLAHENSTAAVEVLTALTTLTAPTVNPIQSVRQTEKKADT